MNWIDEKYKELFGKRSFPESMKKEGWDKAQSMLDAEFPVQPTGTSATKVWHWGLGGIAAAAVIGSVLWLTLSVEEPLAVEGQLYSPRPVDVQQEVEELEPEAPTLPGVSDEAIIVAAPEKLENAPTEFTEERENSGVSTSEKTAPVVLKTEQTQDDKIPGEITKEPFPSESLAGSGNPVSFNSIESSTDDLSETATTAVGRETRGESAAGAGTPQLLKDEDEASYDDNSVLAGSDERSSSQRDQVHDGSRDKPGGKKAGEMASEIDIAAETSDGASVEDAPVANVQDDAPLISTKEKPAVKSVKDLIADTTFAKAETDSETADELSAEAAAVDWHLSFPIQPVPEKLELPGFAGKRFSISAFAGAHYVDKFLDAESELYLQKREEEEKPIWATATGVEIIYYLDGHWTFGTGFTYAGYGEELHYSFPTTDTTYLDGRYYDPHRYRSNLVGLDSVRIIDSINSGHWGYFAYYQRNDTAAEANNGPTNWTYLEIPVLFGYRFGNGAVKPWLRSGISLGLPIQTSYRYVNTSSLNLSEQEASQRHVALQWNYLVRLGIDWKLARHWSLQLNTAGSLQLNSVFRETDVRQRYYRVGGNLGVTYHF